MLKIVKQTEAIEVKQLITTIYGPPGVGKTTTAFTADKVLLLDFDKGAYRSIGRKDSVQVSLWSDVANISQADCSGYETLVVDTGGRMLDMMTDAMIKDNSKMGRNGGQPSMQGWGKLKADFAMWLKRIREFGLDIIIIAHSSEDKNGDDIVDRIDVQGSSKNEIYKVSDMMGRISIKNGKRVLNFSPTDVSFGKNPAQFDEKEIPTPEMNPNFMGQIIDSAKQSLNAMSAESVEVQTLTDTWIVKIGDCMNADEFDAIIPKCKEADPRIIDNLRRMVVQAAQERGFTFNAKEGKFV